MAAGFRVELVVEGAGPAGLPVHAVATREAMNAGFSAEVALALDDAEVDASAWVLGKAELRIVHARDGRVARRLAGVVTKVREAAEVHGESGRIWLTVESPTALLGLGCDARVVLDTSAPALAREVLEAHGLRVEARLARPHPKRAALVQHHEPALAFVERTLADAEIATFYVCDEGGPRLVLVDTPSGLARDDVPVLPVVRGEGLLHERFLTAPRRRVRVTPTRVTVADHDPERPALDATATASRSAPWDRTRYEHPAGAGTQEEAAAKASRIADALAGAADVVRFEGTAPELFPGRVFRAEDVDGQGGARSLVAREVALRFVDEAGTGRLTTTILAAPHDAPVAPVPSTTRPRALGPTLARVVGAPGDEVHVDALGRVKVAFAWDRRANGDAMSSPWARVVVPNLAASAAVPRVGFPVLVDFEEGLPERPIVLGRLFDGEHPPPYALPAGATMTAFGSASTPGAQATNELRFEDAAGEEQVRLVAARDLTVRVAGDRSTRVGAGASSLVQGDQRVSIHGASVEHTAGAAEARVGGDATWEVSGSARHATGEGETIDVHGARTLLVGGNHRLATTATEATSVAGALVESVGGSVSETATEGVALSVAGGLTQRIAGARATTAAAGVTTATLGAHALAVGGALVATAAGDVAIGAEGAKSETIGGARVLEAGGDVVVGSGAALDVTVGAVATLTGGTIVLEVGGARVAIGGGAVTLSAPRVTLSATGPLAEGPLVEDK